MEGWLQKGKKHISQRRRQKCHCYIPPLTDFWRERGENFKSWISTISFLEYRDGSSAWPKQQIRQKAKFFYHSTAKQNYKNPEQTEKAEHSQVGVQCTYTKRGSTPQSRWRNKGNSIGIDQVNIVTSNRQAPADYPLNYCNNYEWWLTDSNQICNYLKSPKIHIGF